MAKIKKLPLLNGDGALRLRGRDEPVNYEIAGEPHTLSLGRGSLRGAIYTSNELAEQAFRRGDALLTLEGGKAFRLTMLGHSAGTGTVYFEMRV